VRVWGGSGDPARAWPTPFKRDNFKKHNIAASRQQFLPG